ncbi:MAG: DNA internalization-related competence protein ComEC/Rec2 [Oscillospiraceae bacterium]
MRKLFLFCVGFAAAVFAWNYCLPGKLAPWLGGFCALLALGLFVFSRLKQEQKRALPSALLALGLALGLLWSCGYDGLFRAPARALEGGMSSVTLTVTDFPTDTKVGSKIPCKLQMEHSPDVKVMFYATPEGMKLRPGDRVTTLAQCAPATALRGEEVRYYTAKGVFLIVYARGDLEVTTPEKIPLTCRPAYWSRTLREAIFKVMPPDAAGVTAAIVTGNRDGLSDAFDTALSRTGMSHAVAVSGMHISFLVAFIMLLLGSHRRRGALICVPLILLFMVTAGSTPSIVRAAVMQLILLAAPLLGRESDSPTSLSFALFLLLLQNPFAAASVGLQLSFAAVAGIMVLSAPMQKYLTGKFLVPNAKGPRKLANGALRFLISTLSASLGAIVFTTPLVAYYFGTVSLIAPLANLLTLWSVSIIFVGGLVAALLGLIALPLGGFLGLLLAPFPRYFHWAVTLLGAVPFAAIGIRSVYYALWLLALYCVIVVVLLCRKQRRMVAATAAVLLCLCSALLFTRLTYSAGDLSVTALDVGQGQSLVLTSGGTTALVDCGGNKMENAGDIAANYLQDMGVSKLDYLILTHCHADHAGGVPQLLSRIPVDVLVLPQPEEPEELQGEILALAGAKNIPVRYLTEDSTLPLQTASLRLYAPMGDGGTNEEGLSVVATAGDFDALITGDMGTIIEEKLVKYGSLPDCELYIVGHHGSKHASSPQLLDTIRAETAIISVGYNSYGHPTDETLLRLNDRGTEIYRTDLYGTVTVTSHKGRE